MREEVAAVVGCLGFAALFFGFLGYSEHMRHVEKMECVKARGDWIDKACVFKR